MPDSVKNNKELAKYWDAYEVNNEGRELATPNTKIEVVSMQKQIRAPAQFNKPVA